MMGFTPTFYAGRPKLSEVTIDSDLNMGGRNISSVDTLRADLIRAGRVDSPYTTETWPTETLDWGDTEPVQLYHAEHEWYSGSASEQTVMTLTKGARVTITAESVPGKNKVRDVYIKVNGTEVAGVYGGLFEPLTSPTLVVNAGDVITITAGRMDPTGYALVTVMSDGLVMGAKTFNLSGKWLALGLDMKGLAATVKIQGVEMPYSDYAKYFPLAPTELKIPGNWSPSQERPVIKVYK